MEKLYGELITCIIMLLERTRTEMKTQAIAHGKFHILTL